jgi:hypothetical protein
MIEVQGSFLTPIKTVMEDERVLGYMVRLADDSYAIQRHNKPMEHAKSKADALKMLSGDSNNE